MNSFQRTSKTLMGFALVGLLATSCKKDKNDDEQTTDDTSVQSTHATDEANVQAEFDESLDDANAVLSGITTTSGKKEGIALFPCNATIDSSKKAEGIITITYNGNNCLNTKKREGVIIIQLMGAPDVRWRDKGAVVKITFTNFKVTRLDNNKSLTFNGSKTVTNVEGGLPRDLGPNLSSVIHKVRGDMEVTFDDATKRTWEIARKRTFSFNGTGEAIEYKITFEGDTTVNSLTDVATWGKNRNNEDFYVSITTPVVVGSTCNWLPVSGVKVHKGIARELTVTFGVDQTGNSVSTSCPYGYKLNWTNIKNQEMQAVISY